MKISGRVVSTKPISLSRASKLVSRFAAVENGSSPAVSLYLQRTSDAFNHLAQFHAKPKNLQSENESARKIETKIVSNSDVDSAKKKKKKKEKKKEKRKRGDAENSGSKKGRAEESSN